MKANRKMRSLAMKVECYWLLIQRGRAQCAQLIAQGLPLSSPELVELCDRLSFYSLQLMRAKERYEQLSTRLSPHLLNAM